MRVLWVLALSLGAFLPTALVVSAAAPAEHDVCEGEDAEAMDVSLLQVGVEVTVHGGLLARDPELAQVAAPLTTPVAEGATREAKTAQASRALEAPAEHAPQLHRTAVLAELAASTSGGHFCPRAFAFTVGVSIVLVSVGILSQHCEKGLSTEGSKDAESGAAASMLAETKPVAGTEPQAPAAPQKAQSEEDKRPALYLILFYVLGHSIAASTLTLINKAAMKAFHPPAAAVVAGGVKGYVWTLVVIQFTCAATLVRLTGATGLLKCEPLEFRKALAFFPAAGMFMITIVAGNAVMNYSNVNTFLVLRSLVPLPCNISEILIYKDPLPPFVSWAGLLVTVCGAVGYAVVVGGIALESVAWAAIYLVTMPIDGLLIKQSISSSNLSPWGLVYYNNTLAALPAVAFMLIFEMTDRQSVMDAFAALVEPQALLMVSLTCALGIAISYFQLNTRYYISATAFMVLGVVNKFVTVLINNVFMEHQGTAALLCVLASLAGAVLWQQTVGWNAVKVRQGGAPWEKSIALPFCLACVSLAWSGYVQFSQQTATVHSH